MDIAINDLAAEVMATASDGNTASGATLPRIQPRPFGLHEVRSMRRLGPEDVEKLVAVRGMVVRASGVIPNMRAAHFRCAVCEHCEEVEVDIRDRIAEPGSCASCRSKGTMAIVHNRCTFADKQVLRLQETPESIPEGETPQTVTLFAYDTLVDAVKPGDRVEVTGVFRVDAVRSNPSMRTVRALYRTWIDAVHFRKTERRRT
jgi:DNA replication licensing factor MCM4